NDQSLVLRLDWRGLSLLLPGDLGPRGEATLLERGGPLRVLALKVAHHGSRFSSTAPFLQAAHPTLAGGSGGPRHPLPHPSPGARPGGRAPASGPPAPACTGPIAMGRSSWRPTDAF